MKNNLFDISFDKSNGTVKSIVVVGDEAQMNWCLENSSWGALHCESDLVSPWRRRDKYVLPLVSFDETESSSKSVYEDESLRVSVTRSFAENGNFCEQYLLKNLREDELFLEHGALGIELPLNDVYTYADDCMTNHCNAHIWCGQEVSYVNAIKMGVSDTNLGIVLTKGSIKSYSVLECRSNHRGIFILDNDHIELLPDEEYVISFEMFVHKGKDDFEEKRSLFDNYVGVFSNNFTVFENENIEFEVRTSFNDISISCNGEKVGCEKSENGFFVKFTPKRLGEHRFDITVNGIKTYAEFFVAEEFQTLVKKRIDFIIKNQQYSRTGSALDGAFLIYDNKEKHHVFNSVWRDHNACRERTGMALLIAKYLQTHNDESAKAALSKYLAFAFREFVDTENGEVFDGVRKNAKYKRLYNAPWMMTLLVEVYYVFGDKKYLEYAVKLIRHYYSNGGYRFYPNGLSMSKIVDSLKDAELYGEAQEVLSMFCKHVDNIVANGLSYPKHEVNFEQTIVSPAATFTSQLSSITGEQKYTDSAKAHVSVLERFSGRQPSFHLFEIPIRYWDDYWFGKSAQFGDVFPHYWSCLTARSFAEYHRAVGSDLHKLWAKQCVRNCLCLFGERGEASCAYVYPFKANGNKGEFYDEWANDQDFALYFYMCIFDTLGEQI